MKLKYFQKGFNYSQDGRGNRLIYHLQGCNMKCPWCANPEGMDPAGVLMTDPDWLSEACCPRGAVKVGMTVQADMAAQAGAASQADIAVQTGTAVQAGTMAQQEDGSGKAATRYTLDRRQCASCTDKPCITRMRQKGIRLSFQEQEISDILKECVRSRPMFFDGGGVTLTGGEMSLQLEAVCELLEGLGTEKIPRCIETNGSHPRAERLLPLVDEWIMDFKHFDDAKHRQWLGIGNGRIKETLELVTGQHRDVLIRIPMMPGFNDSKEDAEAFAAYLGPLAAKETVRMEVLTYHEFGKAKWAQCGMEYRMQGGRITPEARACLEGALRAAGLRVVRT